MTKYFYDTEFIEDGQTIDLISIGIVSADGREYYAINEECDFDRADRWVKENVIAHLPLRSESPELYQPRRMIARGVVEFMGGENHILPNNEYQSFLRDGVEKPELWAYYSAYDHVAFCQLFGRMIDLPKGLPMYTNDLKQLSKSKGDPDLKAIPNNQEHSALDDARWNKKVYEYLINL